ncbi:hypothetical protein [Blastopirellula marina]|uniref:Uncharacterized protein n=1 Tax=Blastopirellula marina TaxID=124 RepID=A0A2S8F757_9BACT|nr:hypothetical protein [Blastopirellula marina]PQO27774.1 hypothetical protein C5Y98_27160 [Blastopirellula marina]PTL41514.1 hypothetical protein C5Y97_27175 [Blastopirellula marina]
MDWLEKLNAERRGDSAPPKPPPQEPEPPRLAIIALGLLVMGHLAAFSGYNEHQGFRFAATFQAITLGFWIGAGSGPFWLRWGIFGLSAPYFRLLIDPDPGSRFGSRMRIQDSPLEIGLLILFIALTSYVLPRVLSPVRAKRTVPQYAISELMLSIGAVALICVLWRPEFTQLDPSPVFQRRYVEESFVLLPLSIVVASVGSVLCFSSPATRKTVFWRAIGVCGVMPFFCYFVLGYFGVYMFDDFTFATILTFPVAVVLLYPLDFAANGFGVRWLRKLDERPPADEAGVSAGEDVYY